ncbi:hypothetical protein EIP91_005269 [Steccherinum ochraceum]|uniref:Cytochrome P450 n=1 Tax=Steccherinum ochraceum TaxID=92696 RepID=A0A4R0RZM0_9APHY|nr:hypothetical protein EIP91_005269 [Steccherinum ochraceum]
MLVQLLWPYGGTLLAALIIWHFLRRKQASSGLPLPPGPKPKFLIGNILDMPTVKPWLTYREWSQKYGDVVFLDLPAQPTILVGSAKVVFDLLEKRSEIYSDRRMPIMLEMMSWAFNFAFMGYGPVWRAHRRSFHEYFNPNIVHKYHDVQLDEARAFLHRLLVDPENGRQHIRQMVIATIVRIVYGMKIKDLHDDYIRLAHKGVEGLVLAVVPGAYWVEYLPMLRHIPSWVPGTSGRKLAEAYRPIVEDMRNQPFENVQAALAKGEAVPCVTASMIREIQDENLDAAALEERIELAKNVTALAYSGAADTTTCAAEVFMLAMGMYPDVQKKAQDELDRVVGPHRLPEFSDLESLVYIRAVAMETMRWSPVNPFSVPHTLMAEDEYNGYRMPKGSTILVNAWSILHNTEDYPDPSTFNPDRFIKDGKINPDVRDPTTITFGFGRRICPGRFLSNASLAIYIASTLHVFNIAPGFDKAGYRVRLTTEVNTGLVASPVALPREFTPRSPAAVRLIQQARSEIDR